MEEIFNLSSDLNRDISDYLLLGRWPTKDSLWWKRSTFLSWYLQWYGVPCANDVRRAIEKIKDVQFSSSVPLLHILFPRTHVIAIGDIKRCYTDGAR